MTASSGIQQPDTEAKTVLRTYLAALTAGDIDAIADCFAEDATWPVRGTMPLSGIRRGRAAIMEFLISAGSLYQPGTQTFTFGQITSEADRAVLESRVRGTASATGQDYDAYSGVFRHPRRPHHRDSRISRLTPRSPGPVRPRHMTGGSRHPDRPSPAAAIPETEEP